MDEHKPWIWVAECSCGWAIEHSQRGDYGRSAEKSVRQQAQQHAETGAV